MRATTNQEIRFFVTLVNLRSVISVQESKHEKILFSLFEKTFRSNEVWKVFGTSFETSGFEF